MKNVNYEDVDALGEAPITYPADDEVYSFRKRNFETLGAYLVINLLLGDFFNHARDVGNRKLTYLPTYKHTHMRHSTQ
jgi:hypothetical protein